MRITSGNSKGRQIKVLKGDITRPALAIVREAIFSSLGDVTDLIFLDVFAGSGSLGFEALSRGAGGVFFVEAHPRVISVLIENINSLGFSDKAHVFKRKMPQGIKTIKLKSIPDVIFCDPPYDKNLLNPTLTEILKCGLIGPDTILIVEHTVREVPKVDGLIVYKNKVFGQTCLSYLKRESF